jgi:predicted AlkP superfamily pyrophosphatase or phosphodiesterase
VKRTVVLDVVGLTPGLLAHAPNLSALAKRGAMRELGTVLPAVTCSVQSTFLTGTMPRDHGAVGNGWYARDLAEVMFWKQSNHLVTGEMVWDAARRADPDFTCAVLFWWFNMYSSVDVSVTPRPIYWADGLKVPDFYTHPKPLHGALKATLGDFPLFDFWGPRAGIKSTRWIAQCARHVYDTRKPTLTLVYLPHLDYDLQRKGPAHPDIAAEVKAVDAVAGELIEHVEADGARVIVLSEYGITEVSGAVHLNRALRQAGLIEVREELGLEKLDAGASEAFAVVDHQVAHVYVRRRERVDEVRALIAGLDGVDTVLAGPGVREHGLDHARAGDLVAIARPDRWFTYYYWLDDAVAPEYARTVDIHRKPGYDPVELFTTAGAAKVGWTLLKKKAGFRYLMDVIPLDASLVKGSHGRLPARGEDGPLIIASDALPPGPIAATQVKDILLSSPA